MQRLVAVPLLLASFAGSANAVRTASEISPVTRVVDLLKSLTAKIEFEGKKEQDLFETYVCWAKKIIDTKTASNAAATSRIETLTTYISDLDAGRIELTSERTDLEKEIEQLSADIELAEALRKKENSEFLEAKDEMDKAIEALKGAISVLTTATEDHKSGVLLSVKGLLRQGSGSRTAEAASLSYAVQLGNKFLSKGDSLFLQRLLTGDVPTPDWKKLNRPANFKKSYKARSFKIQDVLAKLLETFASNEQQAQAKEDKAQAAFEKLSKAKKDELTAAQTALSNMDKENGAKALSKDEAAGEKSSLEQQVTDDTKYIGQVEKSLADKKAEWKERSSLRSAELKAMSQAISILHSGDARDLFKKSFKSQGHSFLQEESISRKRLLRSTRAADALRVAAHAVHDRRLAALATRLSTGGHFDDVIAAIDTMLELLQTEETDDLKKKEDCEKDRAADTRSAILDSREIDDMSDLITSTEAEVEELARSIADKKEQVKTIEEELKEAKRVRDDENKDYLEAKAEDEDAKKLVDDAAAVLSTFYSENGLMLVQSQQRQTASEPGEAPPPPPPTWEAPYGGKTGESTGVIAVLKMISEDITKDITHADNNEQASLDMYTKTKTALEKEQGDLNGLIDSQEIEKGDKETKISDTQGERRTKKGSLEATLEKIDAAEAGCDFFTLNFPVRSSNRQTEIDGLQKAKAILSGASFAMPDPDREIKPGDALLQNYARHLQ